MVFEILGSAPFTILLISIVIMTIINILYKFLVKQKDAKALKDRVKELQDQMKKYQKEGNKEKTSEMLSEMLSVQNKLMKMSLKPMLISLVIFALFLPFISGIFGDVTVKLNDNFGEFSLGNGSYQLEKTTTGINVIGAGEFSCQLPCAQNLDGYKWKISQHGEGIVFARVITQLPAPLPILGNELGWLGWYIMCTIPIVIILRKALKIYI